jgi:DNA-binding transcriptional LysR family regulator
MLAPRHLPLLVTFVQVCREGSFTKAARELGVSKSIVSAHMRLLEDVLGARLLERSTRHVAPTQIGQEVLSAADRMLSAANDIATIADAKRTGPSGVLRVAAPVYLGALVVAPAIARLCMKCREFRAELVLSDERTDPIAHRLDVTVSVNVPQDSALVTMQLGSDVEIIVGAPELAELWRGAAQPQDLSAAPWVVHSSIPPRAQLQFRDRRGMVQRLAPPEASVYANTCEAIRALVAGGAGLAILPSKSVAEDLRAGRMVRVLPEWKGRAVRIHACVPSQKHPPTRVTLFLEELRAQLDGSGDSSDTLAPDGDRPE